MQHSKSHDVGGFNDQPITNIMFASWLLI